MIISQYVIVITLYRHFGRLSTIHRQIWRFRMNAQNLDKNLYNSPDVATKIKLLAKSKNISLKQMLEDCGIGSNAMSHLLHGKTMAFDSLARIADYLDCSVDFLLGRTNNPEVNK